MRAQGLARRKNIRFGLIASIVLLGLEHAEYVPWTDVERVDLDRPPAIYPPGSPD